MHLNTAITYNKSISNAPFDVIIVPGLPYDSAKINPLLKARIIWAKELYNSGITKNIIFSGSAVCTPYIEAVIMQIIADSIGIPTRHIFIEDKALHSVENIDYGVKLAHTMGFKNVALATDPFQAIFLKKYTNKNHGHVRILPFNLKSMPVYYKTDLPVVNPEKAFVTNFITLKERVNNQLFTQD